MDRPGGLFANRFYDPRMSVAQSVYSQPGYEVQIAIPFPVVDEDALAPFEGDGIAVISGQQKTARAR
jgi:hypothetical protein